MFITAYFPYYWTVSGSFSEVFGEFWPLVLLLPQPFPPLNQRFKPEVKKRKMSLQLIKRRKVKDSLSPAASKQFTLAVCSKLQD